jgi:hypothetical protein
LYAHRPFVAHAALPLLDDTLARTLSVCIRIVYTLVYYVLYSYFDVIVHNHAPNEYVVLVWCM